MRNFERVIISSSGKGQIQKLWKRPARLGADNATSAPPGAAHTMASSTPEARVFAGFRTPRALLSESLLDQIFRHEARPLRGPQLGVVGEQYELDPFR